MHSVLLRDLSLSLLTSLPHPLTGLIYTRLLLVPPTITGARVCARASIHDGISSPSMKGSRVGWMIVAPPPSPPSDRHASKYQSIAIRAGLGSISKNGEENNNKDDRRNGIPSSSVEQAQFIASLHGDYTYVARERFRYYDSLPISCIRVCMLQCAVCYLI